MNRSTVKLLAALTLGIFSLAPKADNGVPSPLAESLRATEIAFAASVADQDFERFLSFIDEDAVFMSGAPLRGREAIGEAWSVFFGEGAPVLSWEPSAAEVRPGGKLGVTTGPYRMTSKAEDGTTSAGIGTFFSVWQRQADGSWKIIFDSGTPATPVEEDVTTPGNAE